MKQAIMVWICDYCDKESEPARASKPRPKGWIHVDYSPKYIVATTPSGLNMRVQVGPIYAEHPGWDFCCEAHQNAWLKARDAE